MRLSTLTHRRRRAGWHRSRAPMRCRQFGPASSNATAARMSALSSVRSRASNACSRVRAAGPKPMSPPCAASASTSASPRRPNSTWAVNAPTTRLGRGELAGTYGGVGANASIGVGGGGNFLVGGPRNAYALQPISVQGQTGLNVAAGVAGIELEPVGFGASRQRLALIGITVTADEISDANRMRNEARESGPVFFGTAAARYGIEEPAPEARRRLPRRSHHIFLFGVFFMRRFIRPCRDRRRHRWSRPFAGANAQQSRVQVGVLECRGGASVGFIVGSVTNLGCVLRVEGVPEDRYIATIRKVGLDLGITEETALAWGVYAPVARLGPGDLSGNYAGAQGSASVGVGGGGNVLVGGSTNSIALQPLSLQGQVGLNVAAGLESLELRPGR